MKSYYMCYFIIFLFISTTTNSWAYTSGSGSEVDPYEIANVADLLELATTTEDYSSHFILVADIDMSSQGPFSQALIAPDVNDIDGFQGQAFNGVFNGNGYCIQNLEINPGEGNDYIGLFGYAGLSPDSAEIINLGIENVIITGSNSHKSVGALAGQMGSGDLKRCFTAGTIQLGADCENIGGLLGYSTYADVSNSYSKCSIICGSNAQKIGGLMGRSDGYRIEKSYAAGLVQTGSGPSSVGGFLGFNDVPMLATSNFWDAGISGQNRGIHATDLTFVQMYSSAPFIDATWDYVDETENGTNDYWKSPTRSYPMLSWQDYTIGISELTWLSDAWLTDSQDPNIVYPANLYQDDDINLKDFQMLSKSWLSGQMLYGFGDIFDGLETGDFSALNWSLSPDNLWQVTGNYAYEGDYCAQATNLPSGMVSELRLDIECNEGKIGFYYNISGSRNIYFSVDDNLVGQLGATPSWTYAEFDVTEGTHYFKWTFFTFLGGSLTDYARIDNCRIFSPN